MSPKSIALVDNPMDDMCPICKSTRYLNKGIKFLINPECYHRMCSTCVDRIFTAGPASCPVPLCGKTLRKRGFKPAFFADLGIEREVDIRKRVGQVFNRRQEEFETLLDYNDYLQDTEDLIFDLVNGMAKEKLQAEEKLKAYRAMNLQEIEDNKRAGLEEADYERRKETAEKEAARQRRLKLIREQEEGKMDVEKSRRDMLERLANTDEDPTAITRQAQKVILKKSSARRNLTDSSSDPNGGLPLDSSLSIRGLKKKVAPIAEEAYDPFGGINLTPTRYVLNDEYENEWLNGIKTDTRILAGGYSLPEYYARTMFEAFSGLGVFINDEVGPKAKPEVRIKKEVEIDDDVF
ncbi:CDK-activating kinase assembly factor MAT1-domain-containing protein [Amylocarpus encephaloides]|uniref:RNA polymerase II transcription factor B subunit 3 n=1 Tax=Amylocarpus encephaloides TaxID=45428 RepID=A0A9P8C1V6_9HELO|nr:CDK-activating kinase assembly factor MAT1-domain-containing protein [Amylocarpus encephaloides]